MSSYRNQLAKDHMHSAFWLDCPDFPPSLLTYWDRPAAAVGYSRMRAFSAEGSESFVQLVES